MFLAPVKSFIATYAIQGLAIALACALGWGGVQTLRLSSLQKANAVAEAKAQKDARAKEAEWALVYKETSDVKDSQLRAIAAERDRFASELRNRPKRLPEAARPACSGSTGAELADPDARFLEGFGAFARSLQVELAACQGRETVGH